MLSNTSRMSLDMPETLRMKIEEEKRKSADLDNQIKEY